RCFRTAGVEHAPAVGPASRARQRAALLRGRDRRRRGGEPGHAQHRAARQYLHRQGRAAGAARASSRRARAGAVHLAARPRGGLARGHLRGRGVLHQLGPARAAPAGPRPRGGLGGGHLRGRGVLPQLGPARADPAGPAQPAEARQAMKATLPGPKGGYFTGSVTDFRRDQLGFYEACARQYGDVVQTKMGPYRILMIYHPDAIEEMLVTRPRDFIKSPGVVQVLRPLLGAGLLLSEGDPWLRQRRLVQPAFHRQRVAAYGEVMTDFTERHVSGWTDGGVVEVHGEMMALTQAIVGKTLFDADVSGDAHEAIESGRILAEDFGARMSSLRLIPSWVPTPRNL